MKLTKEERARVNAKIDILALVRAKQLELRQDGDNRYKIHCPFHDGDNEASLTIYTHQTPHSWYCFGCNRGHDPMAFYQSLTKRSNADILKTFDKPRGLLSIEDHINLILESGKKEMTNQRAHLLTHCNIALSIKARSVLRDIWSDHEKIREAHRILEEVDEFLCTQGEDSAEEFYLVKQFFARAEQSLKRLRHAECKSEVERGSSPEDEETE